MSGLHNRMPVILNTVKKRENWLSAQTSTDELINMMKPTPNGYIKNYPVSNMVNNIKVKKGDLHAPINSPLTLF
jgi:putative SOS response-associated peptidase YedK